MSDGVSKVFKAISSKEGNPVLQGIKIVASKGSLTLTATDSELTIEKTVPADVKIEGSTVVPGKVFDDFVKRLNKEQIELVLDDKNRLKIKYGGDSEGVLQCMSAADFPSIAEVEGGQYFVIVRNEFKDLINKTQFSVGKDDSRPILKGLLLEIDTVSLTGVALDGYRLAKCQKPIEKASAVFSMVVPARGINEIAKLIDESDDPLSVSVQKNFLKVDLGHTIVISRLLEGEYLNYKHIIPVDFSTIITAPSLQLEAALERAILLSRAEKNNLVRFDLSGETMMITSNSEIGNINEKIPISLNGLDLNIAFNARYFTELLRYLGSESLKIKFNTSDKPCVVEPSGSSDDLLYLILPVRMA